MGNILILTAIIPALSLLLGALIPNVFETSVYSMLNILFSSLNMFSALVPVVTLSYLLITVVGVYVAYWSFGGITMLVRIARGGM